MSAPFVTAVDLGLMRARWRASALDVAVVRWPVTEDDGEGGTRDAGHEISDDLPASHAPSSKSAAQIVSDRSLPENTSVIFLPYDFAVPARGWIALNDVDLYEIVAPVPERTMQVRRQVVVRRLGPVLPLAPVLTAVLPHANQLELVFDASDPRWGSEVTAYEYQTSPGGEWKLGTLTEDGALLTDDDLVNDSPYTVRIRGRSEQGAGAPSNAVSGMPVVSQYVNPTIAAALMSALDSGVAPGAATKAAGVASALLTGLGPSVAAGSVTRVAAVAPALFTGVDPGVTGSVTLAAGVASAVMVGVDASVITTPDAPTLTSPTPGDGKLTINGTLGGDGGSAITGLKYSVDGGAYQDAGSATLPFDIDGLPNGVLAAVTAKAENVAGLSVASNEVTGTPEAPTLFLLDEVPGALAAFAFFDLITGQAGDSIAVRRASDNAVAEIPRVGGSVDEAAIAAHCAGTTGYISTAYDPSGNANHLANGTAGEQPKIYESGAVISADGVIAALAAGSGLYKASAGAGVASHTIMVVTRPTGDGGTAAWSTTSSTGENSVVGRASSGRLNAGGWGQDNATGPVDAVPNDAWALLTKTHNHATGKVQGYVSDIEQALTDDDFSIFASNGTLLWMSFAGTASFGQSGHHAAVVFWPRVVTPEEVTTAKEILSAALEVAL